MKLWLLEQVVGNDAQIDGRVLLDIRSRQAIVIGDNVKINSSVVSNFAGIRNPTSLVAIGDGKIKIGNHVGMSGVNISSRNSIDIGDYVKLGVGVRIYDHDFHALEAANRRSSRTDGNNCRSKPIRIGHDVFIGADSIILKGVEIGDRTIVAAGSVVMKGKYPSDSLIAGNPARIVSNKRSSDNNGVE